jgi:hypothetical protein
MLRDGRIWLGTAVSVVLMVLATAAPAGAVDIIEEELPETVGSGWQAGTCEIDTPECSVNTPGQFFTQAAGHPPVGFTQIIVRHNDELGGLIKNPVGHIKTVLVDLPVGMSVNPQATPQCELEGEKFPTSGCPAATQVGYSNVEAVAGVPPLTTPPVEVPKIAVYNLKPRDGEPARFGFTLPLGLGEVFLNSGVKWDGDYHEFFTIHVPKVPGLDLKILRNRLVFNGTIGNGGEGGAFLTTPSTCFNPNQPVFEKTYNTLLHADSQEEEAPEDEYDVAKPTPPPPAFLAGSEFVESPLPRVSGERVMPTDCGKIPFEPSTSQAPSTTQTDSPMGGTVTVSVPFKPSASIYQSNVRNADVSLPQGLGLNPSSAPSLQTCSDGQFGKGTRNPVACPPGSKIGTIAIDTPPLPDGTLTGNVYLGAQQSRDPASGNEYRILIDAESASRGLSIRLLGNVKANPQTGQLTAQVNEAPQLPFDSVRVTLDSGKGTLTSPPTCGPNKTSHAMTAWSGTPDSGGIPDKGFTLTSAPGGGPCAKTLGERPFAPSFGTNDSNPKGGAFTQFAINSARNDGSQELKGVDVTLPPGLTAKLAGVRYCPGTAIAAAAASSGAAEAAHSSCPDSSLVGSAAVSAGSGANPYHATGKVFLAGPYHGAPLSLAVITPATAGPFDLGSVVVRVALFVDPETARVHAVSDPIPHVFGGALLDIRSIAVKLDRPKFSLNPTNCSAFATSGALRGGGSNPLDPAAFSSFAVSSPFKVNGCENLDFKPKLFMRIFGGTRRAKSPKLRAVLVAREGDANIGRTAVKLPKPLILEQASLANVCTRVQFAAHDCPQDSIYGFAEATTPLLDGPLKGPVYLRSSSHELPDMVADLNGQVDVVLDGRIDSVKGRLRTTFDTVPDVPVSKFVVTIKGGKKRGLLVNSSNLCAKKYKVIARFTGQNGKKANMRPKLRTPCKGKKHHKGKKKGAKN